MKKSLITPVQYLKNVGPKRAKLFKKVGVYTVEDFFYHFPRRYEDRSNLLQISQLRENEFQTLKATVLAGAERHSWKRRGFNIFEVIVGDSTGSISCVWFNQPYLKNYFKVGQNLVLYGKVERYAGRTQMNSPEFEIISEGKAGPLDTGRIIPIYTLPEGLTQRYFRHILERSLEEYLPLIVDVLPYDIRQRYNLLNLVRSLRDIHFPSDLVQIKEAYRRLAFEEFFLFQIPVQLRKMKKKQRPGLAHKVDGRLSDVFREALPFKLTSAQIRVIEEVKRDMARSTPMNRLLEGDVGSGKTIVAIFASLFAIQTGYQVAFMVPTELLAQQHYQNILHLLKNLNINIALLTSSLPKTSKATCYNDIKEGKLQLIVGTHSLLQKKLEFKNLGLVIIDEQHKFGVSQRALLPERGINPDVLIMTATPIPRTLAITLYGDLDISVIDELPPFRKPVKTQFVNENRREEIYRFIQEKVSQGRQAYIIYPIIEESYTLDLQSASQVYLILQKEIFPKFNIGLLHGRLNTKEQHRIMSDFRRGRINILVATTVLEVGIDVPNACVMVIEHAERFGLSQLHQLRGRIGRGEYESYCILISQPKAEEAKMRIRAMVENNDGFRIAEEDLKIRGPGEFFGKRQHGLSELKIANPLTQLQLLKQAREEVERLINVDPNLILRQNLSLREKLNQRFPDYEKYVIIG
ncbi:MAG: ATP-dependent DNA helicase RecG [Candidatus Omnitrophota bacterium]